uniref:Uncharacterized protein n=1 Tax=Lepeophtheirus salmonis TaxID=72036 RepID=A0A0K2TQI4_LEPSM
MGTMATISLYLVATLLIIKHSTVLVGVPSAIDS